MSDRINDFLDKICASVKYRTMHSEIREEFKNHIDEAVFEFEKFSRGHEAAVNMSLSKLGNATEIRSCNMVRYCDVNRLYGISAYI